MSGDVQPRKRKDKKKKKDELGIEEPRGTAAALGEGDIFMHSYQEHGTGGHWCAKVIFFSLLAVLVALIGLIILENRGLSELEANSVESKYSGVLEGWLEDAHDDDHHDEHTLDLNHHDDEDDDDVHGDELDNDDEDHDDELEHDDDEDEENSQEDVNEDNYDEDEEEHNENSDEQDEVDQGANDDEDDSREANENDEDSEEQNLETGEDEDEIEEHNYRRFYRSAENRADNDDDDDDDSQQQLDDDDEDQRKVDNDDDDDQRILDDDDDDEQQKMDDDDDDEQQKVDDDDDDDDQQNQNDVDDDDDTNEQNDEDNDDEQDQAEDTNEDDNENSDENDQDDEDEEEHNDHQEEDDVEVEHIEQEVFDDESTEAPTRKDDRSDEVSSEVSPVEEADEDEIELLEPDDLDELPEELPIPLPKGKPLAEVDDTSTEKPQDTLADEEEYERQQEALRKEKEQASQGMWLKLVVGGALLVATQAVLRRATAPRETESDVDTSREETPLSDRRMTLIADPVPPPTVTPKPQEVSRPVVQKEVLRQAPVVASSPPQEQEDDEEIEEEEEEEEINVAKDIKPITAAKHTIDRELYSEDEDEDEEEIIEEKIELPKPAVSKPAAPIKEQPKPLVKETPKPIEKKEAPIEREPTPEDEEDDDVEIIEEEDIGEDLEEEEEDISDVDDVELLNRLEAKYGRLPEPERPGRQKDGGNSIADEWPGEPSEEYWRHELDQAEQDLRQGKWNAASERASAASLRSSARARYIVARALDGAAEAKRDNNLLSKAIAAYLELLKMNDRLSDKKLIEVTNRTLDRMKFRGNYLGTEPLYRILIRRFPDNPAHRNNLTVSFLLANRVDLAEDVIKETLKRWPDDRVALAHYGFILKTLHNKLEEAVDAFSKALEGDTGPANEPRFYYHLGDSLLLLGRFKEAHEVHKRGAKLGHFLSPEQRSLYNVDRLNSKPWWDVNKTPYARLAQALEKSWKEILKEGQAAQELYVKEKEGLKERGEWSQLDLFVRGREVPNRCSRAPVTCSIVKSEIAASGCRRGQIKFSSMEAGTHVRPHVGPTNCRLRMHLGLSNTKDTYIRVDKETRQWQTGKVLMFDDSFEHEVWHNGTGTRLVLIVDVWHPDLTGYERKQLPAI